MQDGQQTPLLTISKAMRCTRCGARKGMLLAKAAEYAGEREEELRASALGERAGPQSADGKHGPAGFLANQPIRRNHVNKEGRPYNARASAPCFKGLRNETDPPVSRGAQHAVSSSRCSGLVLPTAGCLGTRWAEVLTSVPSRLLALWRWLMSSSTPVRRFLPSLWEEALQRSLYA